MKHRIAVLLLITTVLTAAQTPKKSHAKGTDAATHRTAPV